MVLTRLDVCAQVHATLVQGFLNARERVRREGKPLLVCVSLPPLVTPDLQVLAADKEVTRRGYWLSPDGEERCALGSAAELIGEGEQAITEVATQWESFLQRVVIVGDCRLVAYGGFAFAPEGPRDTVWENWPGGVLTVPAIYLHAEPPSNAEAGPVQVTAQQMITADSDVWQLADHLCDLYAKLRHPPASPSAPPLVEAHDPLPVDDERYLRAIGQSAADIRAGAYTKVVLSRRVDYAFDARPHILRALRTLRETFSDSTLFLCGRGDDVFLGASPERLVRAQSGHVAIDCLAGTVARSGEPTDDARLAAQLQDSAKNRAEHQAVVEGVLAATTTFADEVVYPDTPQILRLVNVLHLHTPVSGRLRKDSTVLAAVQALHPTPAVAGLPREIAREVIKAREPQDRGYYAGPFGFVDGAHDGDFVVALRSALVRADCLSLFAGGGIMGDSDPSSEWAETEWKMRPMRTAFALSQTSQQEECTR